MANLKDVRDPVGLRITTTKLNGKNYLLCDKSVQLYIGEKGKLKLITNNKPLFLLLLIWQQAFYYG